MRCVDLLPQAAVAIVLDAQVDRRIAVREVFRVLVDVASSGPRTILIFSPA